MTREKFDPTKSYGTQPPREVAIGMKVRNEALYPATIFTVVAIEMTAESTTNGRLALMSVRGDAWFSAPYKWVHEDGTAIQMPKESQMPETEKEKT